MKKSQGKPDAPTVIVITLAAVACFVLLYFPASTAGANAAAQPTPTPKKAKTPRPTPTPRPYRVTEFPHSQKAHKLECNTCHKFPSPNWNKVRSGEGAFPDITEYPQHDSCVRCHKQQFFKGTPPKICSICHTNVSPTNSNRHPFPNPRELYDQSPKGKVATSDFMVGFPHDKHIEIVSANGQERPAAFVNASFVRGEKKRAAEESCKVCHQTMIAKGDSPDDYFTKPPADLGEGFWLKKGTFKSAPIGHTLCFTCHAPDSGMTPEPKDCGTCHKLKPPMPPADFDPKQAQLMGVNEKVMLDAWSRRQSAGKFQHEFMAHIDMSCSTCHNVLTLNTADWATRKVSIAGCATCHATATPDDGGAITIEADLRKKDPKFQCVKCHITLGKMPIPKSHTDAIVAAGGK